MYEFLDSGNRNNFSAEQNPKPRGFASVASMDTALFADLADILPVEMLPV